MYPLHGGGIGQFVTSAARLLSRIAEVTIFTTSLLEERYQQLRAVGDERLPGVGVRVVFVPEPSVEEAEGWYHVMHCYSARVLECLREAYPDGGPDLIEFPDYLGEGFVTLQAAWALDPFLAKTRVCVQAPHHGGSWGVTQRVSQAGFSVAGGARVGAVLFGAGGSCVVGGG